MRRGIRPGLLPVILKNFLANFSQLLAIFLETCQNTEGVGNCIAAELVGVGRAGRLLLRCTLQRATGLTCRLAPVLGKGVPSKDLDQDEGRADSKIHCQMP